MVESQQAIKKLQEEISADSQIGSEVKNQALFLIKKLLDSFNGLKEFSDNYHYPLISMLEKSTPSFIQECQTYLLEGKNDELLISLRKWGESAESVSLYTLNAEFEDAKVAMNLSLDMQELIAQKQHLEDYISDFKEILSLKDQIGQHGVDSSVIITDMEARNSESERMESEIKTRLSEVEEDRNAYKLLADEAVGRIENLEDTFGRIEEMKVNEIDLVSDLRELSKQSNEASEEITKILGDANRVSMAASFKERKEELAKSVWIYDGVNYAALAIIAGIAMYAFTPDTEFSLKLIYERLLIALPFGFISWFASRRSQYLFQLKEDYAYKYSSAMAFEGYKRQAESNEEMHDELLKIAITNLGRTPISVFDKDLKHAPTDKVVDAIKDAIPKIK